MTKISTKLFVFADKILNFAQNFEKIPNKIPEITVIILYPILFWFFGYFHEPWFDEAQAWQIAKCASYHDILFQLPHIEGHPPLWHLILSVFAKNNFPYEITLKSATFVFSYITVFLLIFKSPFFRIIKLLLPFTYFLFYQYAVISRPYCLIMLAFCIMAIFYNDRHKMPFKYSIGLILLSFSHAYGLILACFLGFLWFIEFIKEYKSNNKIVKPAKNILVFLILGIIYLFIVCEIFPSKDSFALNAVYKNDILARIVYSFLILPADCFITNIYGYDVKYGPCELLLGSYAGLFVWFFVYFYTKIYSKSTTLFVTFLVPYAVFAVVSTKYIMIQQIGIIFCFIIFIAWITLLNKNENIPAVKSSGSLHAVKRYFILFAACAMFINLYWSFKSSLLDIFMTYSTGKKEACFIKKYNLDRYNILTGWIEGDFPHFNLTWLCIAPYFDKNIFYNFNDLSPEKNYVIHKVMNEEDIEKTFERWAKKGLPDVIAGNSNMEKIFGAAIMQDYTLVFANGYTYIHKGIPLNDHTEINYIFTKKELAEKLGLKEVEPEIKNLKLDLFRISAWGFCKIFDITDRIKNKISECKK